LFSVIRLKKPALRNSTKLL